VSQEQVSKDLVSLLVSSCLSVWSGYVHLLFCTKSFDSKFQVPMFRRGACWPLGLTHVGIEWRGALPRPPSVIGFVLGLYKMFLSLN
jgi:hypothetical protein